jgi:hypothetical protein
MGRFFIHGNDIAIYPGLESGLFEDNAVIHVENDKVQSIKNDRGEQLSEYRIALRSNSSFLPTDSTLQIPDYAEPFWVKNKLPDAHGPPPVWLSVLGRNDFWPIAAIQGKNEKPVEPGRICDADTWRKFCWIGTATLSLVNVIPFAATSAPGPGADYPAWAPMPLSMRVTLFALAGWLLFHLACCCFPSLTSRPNHRAYFVCSGNNYLTYRMLLVMGSLTLSASATALACGSGFMSPDGIPLDNAWASSLIALAGWVIAGVALWVNLHKQHDGCRDSWNLYAMLAYAVGTLAYYYMLYFASERILSSDNRFPTYWRSMNLTNGVSPAVPLLALSIGVYLWVWRSLQGLAFFGPDAPLLPSKKSLLFISGPEKTAVNWLNMFSAKGAANPVLALCKPLAHRAWIAFFAVLVAQIVVALTLGTDNGEPIRSLGARSYTQLVCVLIAILVSIMLAGAGQLLWIWIWLRRLLVHLDRLPLRRSMAAIRGVSWGSVWKMGGNVLDLRYKLLSSQLECATHFENAMNAADMTSCAFGEGDFGYQRLRQPEESEGSLASLRKARIAFARWYKKIWNVSSMRDQSKLTELQKSLAAFAGKLMVWVLLPEWRREEDDLRSCEAAADSSANAEGGQEAGKTKSASAPHIRHAEELVCYVYLGFIQNVMGRIRTLVMGTVSLFIAVTISLACYPFDPRTVVNAVMVLLFFVLGAVIVFVYAQMHRDPILSALTNTKPGELDAEFWIKLVSFGAAPVLGLLATIFPELTNFLFSWVAPSVSSLK